MKPSLWQDTVELPSFPPLEKDTKTDVLVVGGGMAGLLTAYFLKTHGVNCLLIEQGRIASGVTQNTTAKITFQHRLVYHKLVEKYGADTASLYLNANRIAFSRLVKLCQKIDCDLTHKDNYIYSTTDRRILEQEVDALAKIGYQTTVEEKLPLPIQTVGGIRFHEQAEFHPLKFIAAIAKDLNIRENTKLLKMDGAVAVTDRGRITAEKVIIATHFPILNSHGLYFLKLYQHRSYVLALENAEDVNGMYLDEAETGFSFRNYGKYLLLGGGGHRTGKASAGWDPLLQLATKHYPQAEIRYQWATQDCMSLDGLPYIGKYGKHTDRLFVASGFNKWGMTGSALSALILSDLMLDKDNPYASLFSPSRSMLSRQLAINTKEAVLGLITPTVKRCPHLGCALKWNKNERTWDCSCHGSRFDEKGNVINDPANKNAGMLKNVEK